MSIDVKLKDGKGEGHIVHVTSEKAVCVQTTGLPPINQAGEARLFRQFLTTTGVSTGNNDMQVAGTAANPVLYYVKADPKYDIFIGSLNFVIADAGSVLNKFGNVTALSNGCKLTYESNEGEIIINDSLTSNFEFIRMCQGTPTIGDGTNAFRASNVSGNSEGYIPTLDFKAVFGLEWGLRLRAGTTDRIQIAIRDTTTGVDQFDCVAYGFKRINV